MSIRAVRRIAARYAGRGRWAGSAATDRPLTGFVLDSAVLEAERVLADRRWFLISDERWDEFQRLLERPARDLPKLRALLASPSPFADE